MKQRRPLAVVRPVADELLAFFAEQGLVCEVGGSLRRQAPTVGDVDIVVRCESLDEIVLPAWLEYERCGSKQAHGLYQMPDGSEMGVDIWCATEEQWGAFLWYITGSKELNVAMRRLAMAQGLKLSQFGLWRGGERVDDGTERGVAAALGMDWIEPVDRQRYVLERTIQTETEVQSSSGSGSYRVGQKPDGDWYCTCPHHTYRHADCKHIRQVRDSAVAHL